MLDHEFKRIFVRLIGAKAGKQNLDKPHIMDEWHRQFSHVSIPVFENIVNQLIDTEGRVEVWDAKNILNGKGGGSNEGTKLRMKGFYEKYSISWKGDLSLVIMVSRRFKCDLSKMPPHEYGLALKWLDENRNCVDCEYCINGDMKFHDKMLKENECYCKVVERCMCHGDINKCWINVSDCKPIYS